MLAPWQPLLEWWFGWGANAQAVADEKNTLWFGKHHDDEARAHFGELVEQALAGGLDEWQQSPQGWLGLLILLDQLPRMIYRDTPRAFEGDRRAQVLAMQGLQKAGISSCCRFNGCLCCWCWSTPRCSTGKTSASSVTRRCSMSSPRLAAGCSKVSWITPSSTSG